MSTVSGNLPQSVMYLCDVSFSDGCLADNIIHRLLLQKQQMCNIYRHISYMYRTHVQKLLKTNIY